MMTNDPQVLDGTITIPGNPDTWWENGAMRAIKALAADGREFTAADLFGLGVDEPDHPSRYGSVFAKAKAAGIIRKTGYGPSRTPGRNGGICAIWTGTTKQDTP